MQVSFTALLNTISAYWHIAGVIFIVIVLLAVPDNHQSLGYVFGETVNASGFGNPEMNFSSPVFWYVFATGLLMAQYTITGFDASAHMAEETNQASRMAAVGMYMSVVVSVIFGFILLVAVTLAIPSTDGAVENLGFLVPWIWTESMSQNWAEALLFICVVAQFFCVTASLTSASRMLFAFSRDGAVPGHRLWRQVGKNRVPQLACAAIAVLAAAVMIPAIWNYLVGYLVGTGIAVIGLYVAFILPVILRFRLGDKFEHGAWSLGKHYKWIDAIAIIWVAFISILFLLPPYKASIPGTEGWTWEAVNYAPILVGGALLLFGGWWVVSAKNWFKGPVRMGTEEELEQFEQRLEDSTGNAPGACGLGHRHGKGRAGAPSRPIAVQPPPFWSIAWPVTPRASGESSQATVPAMSSGWPIRPSGTAFIASATASSRVIPVASTIASMPCQAMSVSTQPGQIAFTCTSAGASSAENERTSPSSPAFEAL